MERLLALRTLPPLAITVGGRCRSVTLAIGWAIVFPVGGTLFAVIHHSVQLVAMIIRLSSAVSKSD